MDLLAHGVMPGIANREWVEHDPDLDPLRELPRSRPFATLNTLSRADGERRGASHDRLEHLRRQAPVCVL